MAKECGKMAKIQIQNTNGQNCAEGPQLARKMNWLKTWRNGKILGFLIRPPKERPPHPARHGRPGSGGGPSPKKSGHLRAFCPPQNETHSRAGYLPGFFTSPKPTHLEGILS